MTPSQLKLYGQMLESVTPLRSSLKKPRARTEPKVDEVDECVEPAIIDVKEEVRLPGIQKRGQ